jgi:uncharacterized membrane protein YjgN (DUF898 family)
MGQQSGHEEHRFKFGGSGKEYFRIWIVNLLLTILTLGIYSAWAKVRRLKYFYRNTQLAGASFDYHGDPKAILKGRIIAFGLFSAYNAALKFNPQVGLLIGLLLALVMPWLLMRSLRFKLYNSSYRGLRFGFAGNTRGAYEAFFAYPVMAGLTMYLLAPLAHQRMKKYQFSNSRFGLTNFTFGAPVSMFYGVYLLSLGAIGTVGMLAYGWFKAAKPIDPAMASVPAAVVVVLALIFVSTIFVTYMQNMVWGNTTVGEHALLSNVSARRMLWIMATNVIGTALTLGLFKPFATIRLLRYRLECMGLKTGGDLSDFVAGQQQQTGATGEETAEMFDVDISF